MPTLSSILVQRGAVSMRAVEDAIARQVFHGGDLATNLLELRALREDVLLPILAESIGLEAAPPGRLPAPPARVLRLVPGELALRHGIFPLDLLDRELLVATAEPLAESVEDDLGFALDLAITQVAAPLVRIRQAIAEHYGIPLERRYLRLVAKLDGEADPSPSAMPPPGRGLLPVKMPRPISIPSPSFGTGVPSEPEAARLHTDKPAAKTPFVAAHEFVNPSIPKSPPLPVEAIEEPAPSASPAPLQVTHTAPSSEGARARSVDPEGTRALAGLVRKALLAEKGSSLDKTSARPAWKAASRRKGPFTTAMAEREMEEAAASEAVLEILFAFAAQFFEYTALFVVHGDLAEGRDAAGPGADRAAVAAIGVPLDLPSSLARARALRAPTIGPMGEGLDAELSRDLRRTAGAVAWLPVLVRARVVALIYGDDGDSDVELSALGDVLALIALGGAALERIALRKKLGARAPEIPLKARVEEAHAAARAEGVAALARVVTPAPPQAAVREDHRDREETSAHPIAAEARPIAPSVRAEGSHETAAIADEDAHDAIEEEVYLEDEAALEEDAPSDRDTPTGEEMDAPRAEEAEVASFTDEHHEIVAADDDASFAVSPPEEEVLPPSQGPRTARYLDGGAPAPPVPLASLKQTQRGLGGIAAAISQGAAALRELRDRETAAAMRPPRADSWLPIAGEPEAERPTEPRPTPQPLRRGLAPAFEGRAGARVEPVITMGLRSMSSHVTDPGMGPPRAEPRIAATGMTSDPARLGMEPLPRTLPANATAWTSFPSTPPPEAVIGPRFRSERPIPREEAEDDEGVPDWREDHVLPARVPPVRVDHTTVPSVVVDVGAEYQSLIQRVIDGGRGSQEAFADLVKSGEHAIAGVMSRFPGPLRVDRHRARGELPAASQCGPILELVVAIRRPALPFISVRLSSPEAEIRFWASHVLGELRYPEAANALLPRLFDDDGSVRRIARRSAAALVAAGAAGGPILKGLDNITQSREEPVPSRVLAVETMGEIRSGAVVPSLIAALADVADEVAETARRALLLITRQDWSHDARRWQEWWAQNGQRHRIEWLIDALMHEQPSLRRAAGDELKQLTKEYFGYYDDLPKRERERAQALYRAWWDREGRSRFS